MKKPPQVVEVPVEQQDIDRGRSNSVLQCPIALAANRLSTRYVWCVGVKVAGRMTADKDSEEYYSLAADADQFVHEFDSGADVQPQTVHLYYSPGARIYYYGDS